MIKSSLPGQRLAARHEFRFLEGTGWATRDHQWNVSRWHSSIRIQPYFAMQPPIKRLMAEPSSEIRISVRGLGLGMFVSRLDRPWIGTPFPLEGLVLNSQDEIRKIERICNFVYVDTNRGRSPELRYLEFTESKLLSNARERDEVASLRKTNWTIGSDFNSELKPADEALGALERGIVEVMDDLQQGRHIDLHQLELGVSAMVDSILRNPSAITWLKEMKSRDNYSYQHALGCAIWAASFGRHLGLERDELQQLALAGLLCDVGKIRSPQDLLASERRLTEPEIQVMRKHVGHGLDILGSTDGIPPKILEAVATHHERHDGSGYPTGLKGSEIPIYGRILAIVDSYDAMTSIRPYAPIRSAHNAVTELYEHRGTLYQSELVEQFIQTCGIYPVGTLVELTTGEVGVITAVHNLRRLRPSIMLVLGKDKSPLESFLAIDLSMTEVDDEGQPLAVKCGLPSNAYGINPLDLFLD